MSITRILNPQECGWKKFYYVGGQILVSKGWPQSDKIRIDYVRIIQDHSKRRGPNAVKQASSSIIATMLFGLYGALASALQEGYDADVDLDIVLKSGKVIEIRTQDKNLLTYLTKYMPVADPRAKYRKQRGL